MIVIVKKHPSLGYGSISVDEHLYEKGYKGAQAEILNIFPICDAQLLLSFKNVK